MFVVLGLAQLGVALAVRARRTPGTAANRSLPAAVVLSAALQLAGVLLPPLRSLLGTAALGPADVIGCVVAASLPGLALWATGVARRRHGAGRHNPEGVTTS